MLDRQASLTFGFYADLAADSGPAGIRSGRNLDEKAVTLAVVASVRHEDTDYDELLMSGVPRMEARDQIKLAIDDVLTAWR
jgi:hypothetical protein